MKKRTKVLLVEAKKQTQRSLEKILHDDCKVIVADSSEQSIEVMKKENIDIVIFCGTLPGTNSNPTFQLIKDIDRYLPIIVVSDRNTGPRGGQKSTSWIWEYFAAVPGEKELKESIASALRESVPTSAKWKEDLSIDVEMLVRDAVRETLESGSGLEDALQHFKERYIDLVVAKDMGR